MNQVIELLQSHRSIRKFTDRKISSELFEAIIRSGQGAATSNHIQACTVISVENQENRDKIAELAGNQPYISSCSHFVVFCADLSRSLAAAHRAGADIKEGMTEQFIVATVDSALFAQNVAIAAESAGLGICFIGGIRNNPAEISDILRLPEQVYPVFGMCIGYPDQDPEIKPRLPLSTILKSDYYDASEETAEVGSFDDTMRDYYQRRTGNNKETTWSEQLKPLFTAKLRPHMRDFLRERGFEMK